MRSMQVSLDMVHNDLELAVLEAAGGATVLPFETPLRTGLGVLGSLRALIQHPAKTTNRVLGFLQVLEVLFASQLLFGLRPLFGQIRLFDLHESFAAFVGDHATLLESLRLRVVQL